MNEHLFKLKKDGKTVGYCKLIKFCAPLDPGRDWRGWGYSKDGKKWGQRQTTFDTAHPFVTKDKNGKDVFAGDKCKAHVFMEDSPSYLIGGEVVYNNCGYCIAAKSTYYHMNDLMSIELIEEKDNE